MCKHHKISASGSLPGSRRVFIYKNALCASVGLVDKHSVHVDDCDKVWMYEEIMTNDDNLESNHF